MRTLLLAAAFAVSALASAQVLDYRTFPTDGHPMQAIWTPDGKHILVTVTNHGRSGIEVFAVDGDKLKRKAFQTTGGENAQGILLIPHTGQLAVGLSNSGVSFLPLDATLEGKATPHIIPQGDRSGSQFFAATPDDRTLFVSNEYGQQGNVGVIALRRDGQNKLTPTNTAQIPTPNTTPSITISPDGTRLYVLAEVVPQAPEVIALGSAPELQHKGCLEGPDSHPQSNGALYAIDTAKAAALPRDATADQKRDAIPRLVNSGCSPVRAVVSSDGHTIYVTARGDNKILVFDATVLENNPDDAFLRAIPSGGEAPVGLALFDHDRKLLVANSNRFSNGPGSATVIDLADPAKPTILQTIKTGQFPRDITASPDGRTLLLTVYFGNELMLLTMK
jgi:DNA-binding beta-propeller fold protein YncE